MIASFIAVRPHLKENAPAITSSNLVFDPTRPTETDWEKILADATADVIRKPKRKRPTDN